MATVYTYAIEKGISFKDFAMQCARAMGALVMMRDEPMDAKIPDKFEPSDYHIKELKRVEKEIAELKSMSDADLEKAANKLNKEELESNEKSIRKIIILREKYNKMLAQVEAWQPPTPDHVNFKNFMIEQIKTSIEHDCDISYYQKKEISQISGKIYFGKKMKELLNSLNYHTEENRKEIERAEERTRWIKALKDSLK